MAPTAATRTLTTQFRVIFSELQAQCANGRPSSQALQHVGRRYAAEMYLCAEQLIEEMQQAGEEEEKEELQAELTRTQWATCIWQLAMIVFVAHPAVLTAHLLQWFHLNCQPNFLDEQAPEIYQSSSPGDHPQFWVVLRKLIVHGKPDAAVRLLQRHSALQGEAGAEMEQLMLNLETLLEMCPQLAEPELMQPHAEERALSQLELQLLSDFQQRWRVWNQDVLALVRDADAATLGGNKLSQEILSTARLLCGDEDEIANLTTTWHEKLMAKLLYLQPTLLRWQVRDLLPACLSKDEESDLDPFQHVLLAIFRDDPYATVGAIRDAYGEGWLLAHLWDLLWHAGVVGPDLMPDSELGVREHLLLQYARALGDCQGLWQLAALYASDLIDQSTPCNQARDWLGKFLVSQPPQNAVKVRKLLAICERYDMPQAGLEIIKKAAASKRSKRATASQSAFPKAPKARLQVASASSEPTDNSLELASQALKEISNVRNGELMDGPATVELRAMLRCEGIGGPLYYKGPRWLPDFFSLIDNVRHIVSAVQKDQANDGDIVVCRREVGRLMYALCALRTDRGGDALPDSLMLSLLRVLCGLHLLSPTESSAVLGMQTAKSEPSFGVRDVHAVIAQLEMMKGSVLNQACTPCTNASSAAHSLTEDEERLALAATNGLAHAILHEASVVARDTVWGAAF